MKKFKKVLTMVLAFALVICITVAATVAYLSDKTQVATNTFTLGKVDIFLDEYVVDADGNKDTTKDRTQTGNVDTYDGKFGYFLVPGKTVDKDPTVHVVKGSEDCYVRMKVTLNNADKFLEIFKKHIENGDVEGNPNDAKTAINAVKAFFVGYEETIWEVAGFEFTGENKDVITVTFNYVGPKATDGVVKKAADQIDLEPIIKQLTLPAWVTSEDAVQFEEGFEVNVIAEAIQASDTFANATEAWGVFERQTTVITGEGKPAESTEPTEPTEP